MSGAIAIRVTLTIPDNEARTAYATLRRLGLSIAQLERAELYLLPGDHDVAAVEAAVRANEAIFNENMHELTVRAGQAPARGELWVVDDRPASCKLGSLGTAIRLRSWTLLGMASGPAEEATLHEAASVLLCNPAVQNRVCHIDELPLKDTITR